MGGCEFESTVYGIGEVRRAYNSAVEDATYENGNDPYNGTISTTNGVMTLSRTPVTIYEAQNMATRHRSEKWGPALAIPLLAKEDYTIRTATIRVPFKGDIPGRTATREEHAAHREALDAAIRAAVKPRKGETLVSYTTNDYNSPERSTAKVKVVTTTPKEKTETRYFVINTGTSNMPPWNKGYESQAKARAAAVAAAKSVSEMAASGRGFYSSDWSVDYEIISMTRRVSGEPLVKVSTEVVSTSLVVTVKFAKRTSRETKIGGWYFFGTAAC